MYNKYAYSQLEFSVTTILQLHNVETDIRQLYDCTAAPRTATYFKNSRKEFIRMSQRDKLICYFFRAKNDFMSVTYPRLTCNSSMMITSCFWYSKCVSYMGVTTSN